MFLVSTWRGFPLENYWFLQLVGCGSLRKRMQNSFWHFAKSICFPIFSRETPQGSPPPPQLLEGRQQVRDTEAPVALGSGHRRGCLLYWSAEKEEVGQFSSKHNAFLRLEYQKWLVFIVTTGRRHNVYKPPLGPWAEPPLGPWAEPCWGAGLSPAGALGWGAQTFSSPWTLEFCQPRSSLGVLVLRLCNGDDNGTSFPARFWGVSTQWGLAAINISRRSAGLQNWL